MLANTCKKYPKYSALSKRLADLYSASLTSYIGFSWNGRAVSLTSNFIDNCYALGGENLEAEICGLICECLLDPNADNGAFDEGSTALMKTEVIDDIDSVINEKSNYAAMRSAMTAYVGEPQEISALGTREQAEEVTPRSAFRAYEKLLETARISIFCSGASDFAEAERVFAEKLSALKRGAVCEPCHAPSRLKPEPAAVEDFVPMEQAILRMCFKSPDVFDKDAVYLLSLILGGMATSRFFLNIREKRSLCYYCACSPIETKRALFVYSGVEPQNIERTKQAVLDELRDIRENGVTGEELQNAKLDALNRYNAMKDSPSVMVNWYYIQAADEEKVSFEEKVERIKAVTSERIRAAALAFKLDTVYTLMSPDNGGEEAAQ